MTSTRSPQRHVLHISDRQGQRIVALEAATYSLGRDLGNAIVIYGDTVSRQHAILLRVPEGDGYYYRIVDGNTQGRRSMNGLIVNGEKQTTWHLKDGDRVQFSLDAEATYVAKSAVEAQYVNYVESANFRSIKEQPLDPLGTLYDLDEAEFHAQPITVAAQVQDPYAVPVQKRIAGATPPPLQHSPMHSRSHQNLDQEQVTGVASPLLQDSPTDARLYRTSTQARVTSTTVSMPEQYHQAQTAIEDSQPLKSPDRISAKAKVVLVVGLGLILAGALWITIGGHKSPANLPVNQQQHR
jgi:pSer/pThr/pTyr-binding forkhead associated (FHA) protein